MNLRSQCCNAKLEIAGDTTRYFVCHDCGEACDPKKNPPLETLVATVRRLEIDHAPDGWPAVKIALLSALADEVVRAIRERDKWKSCAESLVDRCVCSYITKQCNRCRAVAEFERLNALKPTPSAPPESPERCAMRRG